MTSKTYVDGVTLFDADSANAFNDAIYEGIGLGGLQTIASATTPDIFATTVSGVINYTGTTTCTGFTAAPSAGARRLLVCAGAAVFTAGTNMLIDGVGSGSNLTCAANDLVYVYAVTATQFRLSRIPYAGVATAATQAQMETATDNATMATPLNVNWHPGVAKAWVRFNSAGTVAASWNITSITDNGAGDWTVNIGTDFSSANYCGVACGGRAVSTGALIYQVQTMAAGTCNITARKSDGTLTDPDTPDQICVAFFGDQ